MRPAALVAVLVPLLAVPVASAAEPEADPFCIVAIEALDGFRVVRIRIDEDLDPAQHDAAFRAADADGDGRVTKAEGEAFRKRGLAWWMDGAGLGVRTLALTQLEAGAQAAAPAPPMYAVSWRQVGHGVSPHSEFSGLEVVEPSQFETQAVYEYRFDSLEGAREAVLRAGTLPLGTRTSAPADATTPPPTSSTTPPSTTRTTYTSSVTTEYVVVRAPEGWVVASVQGMSDTGFFAIQPGTATVDIKAFDTKSPYEIRFVPAADGPRDAPGLPFAAALLAVALLAAAVARRGA